MSSETIKKWKPAADADIVRYKINVSSKYLDLTKRKVELTRLPREVPLPESQAWKLGTPKSAVEPLLDTWLDTYSWRDQEQIMNESLPQFRLTLSLPSETDDSNASNSLRIHYVHKRSSAKDAIPLLYVHGYPGSFSEVFKILEPLSSTIPTHLHGTAVGFHVVAPSIPGFGFSDASTDHSFGARETARWWDALMKRMGHKRYVVACSSQGWKIARWFVGEETGCVAVHTILDGNEKLLEERPVTAVQVKQNKKPAWSVFKKTKNRSNVSDRLEQETLAVERIKPVADALPAPQTIAHGLCDSPVGLLAATLNQLYDSGNLHLWSQTDVLNWTMLQWLPGPEAALRWSWATEREDFSPVNNLTNIKFGVTVYNPQPNDGTDSFTAIDNPSAFQENENRIPITWSRSRTGTAGIPALDSPSDVIVDLRRFCADGQTEGWLRLSSPAQHIPSTDAQDFAEGIRADEEDAEKEALENLEIEDEVSRESHWWLVWRWISANFGLRRGKHHNR